MKAAGTQANTGQAVTCPPSHPQDSQVENGEGGPLPQITWRHKTWPTANSLPPVHPPGSRPPREAVWSGYPEGHLDAVPASRLPQGRELEANLGHSRRERRQRQGGQEPLGARTSRSRGFQERKPPRARTSSRGNPQGLEHPAREMPVAKVEMRRPGATLEDVTRTPELPQAKEELLQQGTALPYERTLVWKSLLTEEVTKAPELPEAKGGAAAAGRGASG